MVISIYKPPEDGKTWAEQKCGDICDTISYEYEKYFNGVGTFTLELPVNTRFRAELLVNRILVTDSGDALIIKNIQTTLERIKVTGYDLNGLLCDRVTLGTDEGGYDPCDGSTEYCVKHYVNNNLVSSIVPQRNLPRFGVVENTMDRGLAYDTAYPRYQNLQELVTEICEAAKLGWRVTIDTKSTGDSPIFLFDVYEQTDRSVNQSERDRVIFSAQTHNVSGMTREVGVTSAKNTLYLDIDGTVVQYPREPETDSADTAQRIPGAGYDRREEYCSLSGKSLKEDVYKVEAEHNMADRMQETDSLTIDAGSPLDYGTRYDVGTIVTVFDRERSLQLDSVISAVTVRRSGSEYSVELTLGESKPKLLDQYAKKSEVTQRTVRNDKGNQGADTLVTEYEYLADNSVKFNGVTYTVEKDSATGLISKISDSGGNEFKPTINSGITDVSLHNAVFWAVAMSRGFGSNSLFMPVRTGIGYYFDCEAATPKNNTWVNYMGSTSMALFNASKTSDGAVYFPRDTSYTNIVRNCGTIECDEPETVYIVAKIITQVAPIDTGEKWSVLFAKSVIQQSARTGFSFVTDADNYIYFGSTNNSVKSAVKANDYHIICATRNTDGYTDLYINGVQIGTVPHATVRGNYGGYCNINFMHDINGDSPFSKPEAAYKFVAIGSEYHESGDVLTNTKWLAAKYGVTIK